MAWMPFQADNRTRLMLIAAVLLTPSLTGCEVGRTMFQYSSGASSPWIGIDLMPRKERVTTIRHAEEGDAKDDKLNRASPAQLVHTEAEPAPAFQKKPIRLNLPASRDLLEPTELNNHHKEDFSVTRLDGIVF